MVCIEGKHYCDKYNQDIDRQLQDDMAAAENLDCVTISDNPYIGATLKCGGCKHNKYGVFRDGVLVGNKQADFMGEMVKTVSSFNQEKR